MTTNELTQLNKLLHEGYEIASFMGYEQKKVIITLTLKNKIIKKTFNFDDPKQQGSFMKKIRSYYSKQK